MDPSVTWEDAAWMKKLWDGPFVIKGILSAGDAKRAIEIGADAIKTYSSYARSGKE